MPADLIHRIGIAAPRETNCHAVTIEEGIRGLWTADMKRDARRIAALTGSHIAVGFAHEI